MKNFILATMFLVTSIPVQAAPKKEDPWITFTKWAYYRSEQQNNGKAVQTRTCQPELKLCTLAITFRDNNNIVTIARDTYDENDKLLRRDICRFNKSLDIRTCVDWDTEERSKEMKNSDGEWHSITGNQN